MTLVFEQDPLTILCRIFCLSAGKSLSHFNIPSPTLQFSSSLNPLSPPLNTPTNKISSTQSSLVAPNLDPYSNWVHQTKISNHVARLQRVHFCKSFLKNAHLEFQDPEQWQEMLDNGFEWVAMSNVVEVARAMIQWWIFLASL